MYSSLKKLFPPIAPRRAIARRAVLAFKPITGGYLLNESDFRKAQLWIIPFDIHEIRAMLQLFPDSTDVKSSLPREGSKPALSLSVHYARSHSKEVS